MSLKRRDYQILLLSIASCATAVSFAADVKPQADELKTQQLQIAEELVRDFPNSFTAVQILANVHKYQGNDAAFQECLQRCVEIDPDRSDTYEQLGLRAFAIDDYQAASEHFRKSLAIKTNVNVAVRLAETLIQLGSHGEAERILTAAAKVDTTGQAFYLLGELRFQAADMSGAKEAFEQAIERQSNHRDALYGMVKVSTQLADTAAADRYSQTFARVQSAVAELNQERRSTYDDVTELRRNTAQTLTDAGRLYVGQKLAAPQNMAAQGETLLKRAAAMDPANAACRDFLARYYETTKQPARAVPLYRELIKLRPNGLSNYERLGIRLATDGDFAGAEKVFLAMSNVPANPSRGYRMLAKLYLNSDRQLEKALSLAKQSVESDPVADSHFVLGWALAKNKQFDAARKSLQKAMELDDSKDLYRTVYRSLPEGP